MSENSGIAWTDHTFNPWWGCEEVSPGCAHCYAKAFSHRLGMELWGAQAPRRFFGDKHWNEPLKWNAAAEKARKPALVFCASMADVFEAHPALGPHRTRLWKLIGETPHLRWLLLTKRPENWSLFTPIAWQENGWPSNVWAMVTAENQEWADRRIPHLLQIPAAVRAVSYEPAIGPVDFSAYIYAPMRCRACGSMAVRYDANPKGLPTIDSPARAIIAGRPVPHSPGTCLLGAPLTGDPGAERCMKCDSLDVQHLPALDQIIVGGESGPGARPFRLRWAEDVRRQCRDAGVAFFMKQMGSIALVPACSQTHFDYREEFGGAYGFAEYAADPRLWRWKLPGKGDDPLTWPKSLRVQQFPVTA
jgi:protein gp37